MPNLKEKIVVIYDLEGLISDLTQFKTDKPDNENEINSKDLTSIIIQNRKNLVANNR